MKLHISMLSISFYLCEQSHPKLVVARGLGAHKTVLEDDTSKHASTLLSPEDTNAPCVPLTPRELLCNTRFARVVLAGFCHAFLYSGWHTDTLLWLYTPIPLGGLGRLVRSSPFYTYVLRLLLIV